eukprot:549135-Pyramimonas_sp.AAC.1
MTTTRGREGVHGGNEKHDDFWAANLVAFQGVARPSEAEWRVPLRNHPLGSRPFGGVPWKRG